MNEVTVNIEVDTTSWLQQMEMLQQQIDVINSIIVESWKSIEAFLNANRVTIYELFGNNRREVKHRSSIRKYYKYIERKRTNEGLHMAK